MFGSRNIAGLFCDADNAVKIGGDLAEAEDQLVLESVASRTRSRAERDFADKCGRREAALARVRHDDIPLVVVVADLACFASG